MKNSRIKLAGLMFALLLTNASLNAQNIDAVRMDRDIEIAENILSTLSSQGSNGNTFFFADRVEGTYLEGYGVIFSIPKNTFWRSSGGTGSNVTVIAPSTGRSSGYSYTITTDDDADEKVILEEIGKVKEKQVKLEKYTKEADEKVVETMKTFLVDYAELIGQLQSTDRIKVAMKSRSNEIWFNNDFHRNQGATQSAEILKSDLTAYKQGKISREDALKKVVVTIKEESTEKDKELEVFCSIFSRLYEPDFSSTYYAMRNSLSYERMDNFGVIFNMKVYSSNIDNGFYTIRTSGQSDLSKEERDKKVEEMYPEFEKSLKENLLDYGRTIRSLKPEEAIMFKVALTECEGCDMPKSIEINIKASTLVDYNMGKLSRDVALSQLKVKKIN